jgi:UDP-N-acetylglucosamine enolpyruvyl transferase
MTESTSQQELLLSNFQFILADGADRAAVAKSLDSSLKKLQGVESALVSAGPTRSIELATIATTIGATVVIINQAASAVESITRLIRAIKQLAAEVRGVDSVRIEVNGASHDLMEIDATLLAAVTDVARQ